MRDADPGGEAQQEIVRDSKNPKVTLMIVDLRARHRSPLRRGVHQDYRRLDALVNNAGVFTRERMTTPDGLEMQFAVNYLGGFLLSICSWTCCSPPRRRDRERRSSAHKGQDRFRRPAGGSAYKGYKAYGQSKLPRSCSA